MTNKGSKIKTTGAIIFISVLVTSLCMLINIKPVKAAMATAEKISYVNSGIYDAEYTNSERPGGIYLPDYGTNNYAKNAEIW